MTKPLGIIELLTRVGEDKVQIQNINGTIRGGTAIKRGGIELRVGTGIVTLAELAAGVEDVLWLVRLPRADVDRAIREYRAAPVGD